MLVCGSRKLSGLVIYELIKELLLRFGAKSVVHGAAPGVDGEADRVADVLNLPTQAFPADWPNEGRAAGPTRNAKMLAEAAPDLVIAIHDDWRLGKGTRDMVRRALAANVPVWREWLSRYGHRDGRFIEELPR